MQVYGLLQARGVQKPDSLREPKKPAPDAAPAQLQEYEVKRSTHELQLTRLNDDLQILKREAPAAVLDHVLSSQCRTVAQIRDAWGLVADWETDFCRQCWHGRPPG